MIGAREHYAVPRALQSLGKLHTFFTDAWAGPVMRVLGRRVGLRGLAARYDPAVPPRKVVSFTAAALWEQARQRLRRQPPDPGTEYLGHLEVGRAFAARVNSFLKRLRPGDRPGGFFGYCTGSLETLEVFRRWGLPTLVDQIDAARCHERVVRQEMQKWPGWQSALATVPESYWERLEREWRLADRIVVNSPWTKRALTELGVAPEKIVIVPLAYEAAALPCPRTRNTPAVVLYVGRVVLEKGVPYLFEAARLLSNRPLRFLVAGPIGISRHGVNAAPPNVRLLGPVPRDRVRELYREADVFVLPTLSDGFAITQLEAMAHGLPVIATPNCGEVVTDGEDGRLVPAGDAAALAAAIEDLVSDPTRLAQASRRAVETINRFSLTCLAERLEHLLAETKITTAEASIL